MVDALGLTSQPTIDAVCRLQPYASRSHNGPRDCEHMRVGRVVVQREADGSEGMGVGVQSALYCIGRM